MLKRVLQYAVVLLAWGTLSANGAWAQSPSLSSANPASALQGQAIQISVRGKNFVAGQTTVAISPSSDVTVGTASVANSAQLIVSLSIAGNAVTGERLITVTTPSGPSNTVSFRIKGATASPTFTMISPSSGGTGTAPSVTLTGTNFVSGATGVVVNGTGITVSGVNVTDSSHLTATFTIAGGATLGDHDVKVVTAAGTTNAVTFNVSGSPTLTTITPASGPAGTTVMVNISGTNFVSGTTVTVNGGGVTTGQVTVMSPTSLQTTFEIAAGANQSSRSVTVASPSGSTTVPDKFTVGPPVDHLTFVDPGGTTPVSEVIVNEGGSTQARVRVVDSSNAVKDGVVITYASINTAVATVNSSSGAVTGVAAGFSTLSASTGIKVAATTITVVQVSSSGGNSDVTGVAQDTADRLYLASGSANKILVAQTVGQTPDTYAGTGSAMPLINSARTSSAFNNPSFVALEQGSGTLYVSDSGNNAIRKVTAGSSGQVQTLLSGFNNPQGVALDDRGNLWVVNSGTNSIQKINLTAPSVTTVATGFNAPTGIAFEKETAEQALERFHQGLPPPPVRMLVADTGNGLIKRVTENGTVEIISDGAALSLDAAKSVFASSLQFISPSGIATDSQGNIYVSEPGSGRVKTVLRSGQVVDAVQPNTFTTPRGLAVGRSGRIVVAAASNAAREIRFGAPQIISVSPSAVLSTGSTMPVVILGKNFAPDTTVIIAGTPIPNVLVQDTQTLLFNTPVLPNGKTTVTVQNRGGLAQSAFQVDAVPFSNLSPGEITTVAGGSTFAGDGGPATSAPITPTNLLVDTNGNLLIADVLGHRIRRIEAQTGIITTVAGNGQYSFSGDDGPAVAAALNTPQGIAMDRTGNLFIADSYNCRIRRVDAVTAIITTYAGMNDCGYSGDGGQAVDAQLQNPIGVAVDAAGNLFIADNGSHVIRKVDAGGVISTVAGTGTPGSGGDNGPATSASLDSPTGLFIESAGNLLIADTGNHRIRQLSGTTITTVAGTGTDPLPGIASPWGMTKDANGDMFIADTDHSLVRKVDANTSAISIFAGNTDYNFYGDGGPATSAAMREPRSVAVAAARVANESTSIFIADYWDRRIRKVDKDGIISTYAGTGEGAYLGANGPATLAVIDYPLAVAVDAAGNLYIGDSDNRVRKVDNSGIITIVAGGGPDDELGDGQLATTATVFEPSGFAFDASGNIYVSDALHHRIRKIDAVTKIITTIAGNGEENYYGDDAPAVDAALAFPRTLAMDSSGNLLIADTGNHVIRKVDLTTHEITTILGNGSFGFSPDGTVATDASVSNVWGFVLDPSGNIYIPEYENGIVRRIDHISQQLSTVASSLAPIMLAYDGHLYIMDLDQQAVLRLNNDTTLTRVVGNEEQTAGYSGDGGPAIDATLSYPASMTFDASHNLFIADSNNNRVRVVRGPIP